MYAKETPALQFILRKVYGDDEDKAKEIFLFARKVYPVKRPPAFVTVQSEKYPILAR